MIWLYSSNERENHGKAKLSGSPGTENIGDNTIILNADDGNSIGNDTTDG